MKTVCVISLMVALVAVSSADTYSGAEGLLGQQGSEKSPIINNQGYDKYPAVLIGRQGFGFDKRTLESSGLRKPITVESLQKFYVPIKDDYRY